MRNTIWIALLFWLAAAYDGLLGIAFLLRPMYPFERFDVTPPNHPGYVQFPAALLIVFAVMFGAVALRPLANRVLVLYGFLFKLAFVSVASWHWVTADIPAMWKPLAVVDLVMAVLFALAYWQLRQLGAREPVRP
jgi:hypothetical protein